MISYKKVNSLSIAIYKYDYYVGNLAKNIYTTNK
jgi:hypothetical protein